MLTQAPIGPLMIELAANVSRLQRDMAQARQVVDREAQRMQRAAELVSGAIGAIGAGLSIQGFVRLSDELTALSSRVKLASAEIGSAATAQARLFEIANQSRSPVAALADIYAMLARGATDLGLSQERVLSVTQTLGKAIAISGGSAESARAALVQFGQGLAAGVLRGEELNSVMEQAPRLAQALAEGLGVPIGALRKMGQAGELTSQMVVAALERVSGTIEREFGGIDMTIAQALTLAKNRLMQFMSGSQEAAAATRLLVGAIDVLSSNLAILAAAATGYAATRFATVLMEGVSAAVQAAQSALAHSAAVTAQRAATIAAAEAKVRETAATVAQVAATQAAIIAARSDAVAQLARANSALAAARASIEAATAAGAQSAALAALRGATTAATAADAQRAAALAALATLGRQQASVSAQTTAALAAQAAAQTAVTAATAAGSGVAAAASRALALLGGPIGTIAMLLGVAASAWSLWSSRATDAERAVERQVRESDEDIQGRIDAQIEKLRERNRLAGQPAPEPQSPLLAEAGSQYMRAYGRLQDAVRGTGEFAGIAQIARDGLLPKLGEAVGNAYRRYAELGDLTSRESARKIAEQRDEFMKSYIDSGEKLRRDLAEYDSKFKGRVSPEQYLADTAAIRRKASPGAASGASGDDSARRRQETLDADAKLALERIKRYEQAEIDAQREIVEANEWRAKAVSDFTLEQDSARMDALKALDEEIVRQRKANEEIGLTAEQVAELSLRRQEQALAIDEETLANLRAQGAEAARIEALEEQIGLTKDLIQLRREGAAAQAQVKEAQRVRDEWSKTAEDINRGLTDALFRAAESGKDIFTGLRDVVRGLFNNLVLRPVINAVLGGVGLGGAGSAMAGSGGGGGGAMSGLSSLASLAGASGALGSGIMTALTSGAGVAGSLSAAGSLIGTGTLAGGAAGIGMGLGALGPGALAAYAAFRGIRSLTRRRTTAAGIEGTLGGDSGFTGNAFEEWRRRIGGGGRNTQALDPGMQSGVADAARSTRDAVTGYAQALGLPVQALRTYTQALRIDTRGLNAEQIQERVSEAISAFADGLAGSLGDAVTAFARKGESATETLARLSGSLVTVNDTLRSLNQALLAVGPASGEAASRLLDLFGGAQAFAQAASGFLSSFYSEQERAGIAARAVQQGLQALGIALPGTRAEYRRLVESMDLTTDYGRRAYATLLQLGPQYDIAARYAEEQAQAAIEAAKRVREEWGEVGRSLADEARRIRGEIANSPGADFADLVRRAQAGDVTAARALPDASRAAIDAAQQAAETGLDYDRARAQVAAALDDVVAAAQMRAEAPVSGTQPGSAVVASVQALLPVGEANVTATNAVAVALRDEIGRLREELRAANAAVAASSAETARILARWDGDTLPPAYSEQVQPGA